METKFAPDASISFPGGRDIVPGNAKKTTKDSKNF
nr:MAG: hypothetical protein [Lokiarchaeota virus Skoll Meg22_1214]